MARLGTRFYGCQGPPHSNWPTTRTHAIPLSAPALEIVTDLLRQANVRAGENVKPRYILESPITSEKPIDGHALSVAMSRFGDAISKEIRSGSHEEGVADALANWVAERPTAHDLRRTMATRMAGSGVPTEDVSACLNHARRGVTATHYDHYDRAPEKRRAFVQWAQQLRSLVKQEQ
jgi:integrase